MRQRRNRPRRGFNPPGELTTFAPLSQQSTMTNLPPLVTSGSDGSVRIRHRELIGKVPGSVLFSNTAYPINPGMPQTFPWLSQMAFNYESYLFRKLNFQFKTAKSASTNGREYMAIDYDAADTPPTSSQQISSYWLSKDSAVWQQNEYVADVKDLQKFGIKRYLRAGALAANLDIKTYDVGNFHIAAEDCADATNIGVLFVEYDVELQTPQLDSGAQIAALSSKIVGAAPANNNIYGSAGTATITGGNPVTAAVNTLTFQRSGQYLVEQSMVGTVFTGGAPVITASTATVATIQIIADAGALNAVYLATVNATAGQTLSTVWTTVATTISSSTTRIAAYTSSLA